MVGDAIEIGEAGSLAARQSHLQTEPVRRSSNSLETPSTRLFLKNSLGNLRECESTYRIALCMESGRVR